MLGRDVVDVLGGLGQDVTGLLRGDLDVTDESAVRALVLRVRPAVVVNCAAWTAVDDAEAREDEASAVNGRGAENVAAACAASGSRLVHVSTDYVFGGDGLAPYAEYDGTAPRTAYGRTKLAGEQAVLRLLPETGYVVRTAWLYGAHGPNFVRAMTGLEGRQPIRRCRRRPAGAAQLDGRCRRPDRGAGPRDAPGRHLPRDQLGRGDLVRAGRRGLPAAGRRPGPGTGDHERRLPAAGAAPGLQRARPRPARGRRGGADRRLANGPEPGLAATGRHLGSPAAAAAWARHSA